LIAQPNNDTRSTLGTPASWTVFYPTKQLTPKKWTFLVYMNGANDLGAGGSGNFDIQNVLQMEKVGSSDNVNIVLQWEVEIGFWNSSAHPLWTGTRRYYLTKNTGDFNGNIQSPMIAQNSTVDTGDWESLQDFVHWGVQAFPAEHYCLIIWNHGSGWRAQELSASKAASSASSRSVSFNYLTNADIDTSEIPKAIDISNTDAKKWDIVSFDASLMQMLEVAYQMTSPGSSVSSSYQAPSYIQGSEESPPGAGLPYDTILQDLTSNPDLTPEAFADDFCTRTLSRYGSSSSTTQSVLKTSELPALLSAVDNLGLALMNAKSAWGTQIATARMNAEHYSVGEEAASDYWYVDYKDLLDFTNRLTQTTIGGTPFVNDTGVISAAQSLKTAAGNAIVFNKNGTGHPNSHGVSIWIPSPSAYSTVLNTQGAGRGPSPQPYTTLQLPQQAPNWRNFLQNGPAALAGEIHSGQS